LDFLGTFFKKYKTLLAPRSCFPMQVSSSFAPHHVTPVKGKALAPAEASPVTLMGVFEMPASPAQAKDAQMDTPQTIRTETQKKQKQKKKEKKKLSPEQAARAARSKELAAARQQGWAEILAREEGPAAWGAAHGALAVMLKGKMLLDWAVDAEAAATAAPKAPQAAPTADAHAQLAQRLRALLDQRPALLAATETKRAQGIPAGSLEEPAEKAVLQVEAGLRAAEEQRWAKISPAFGNNAHAFPVGPASSPEWVGSHITTPAALALGAWGVEHKVLEPCDANAAAFELVWRPFTDGEDVAETPIDSVARVVVDPCTLRAGLVGHFRVTVSAEENAAGRWGVEHKVLEPCDANAAAFELVRRPFTDGKDVFETPIDSVARVVVDPATLRAEVHAEIAAEGVFYGAEQAADIASSEVAVAAAAVLTPEEQEFFETGWAASLAIADSALETSLDDPNRLAVWKYFKSTDIIREDRMTPAQAVTFAARAARGPLSATAMRSRRSRLARHFARRQQQTLASSTFLLGGGGGDGKAAAAKTDLRAVRHSARTARLFDSKFGPADAFFEETVVACVPADQMALNAAHAAAELTVGWVGSLAESHCGLGLVTSLDEDRLAVWKYYTRADIIATDRVLPRQAAVWASRSARSVPLLDDAKALARRRARLAKRFKGARCAADFFTETLRVCAPSDQPALNAAHAELERTLVAARAAETLARAAARSAAVFASNVAIDALLINKNAHFVQVDAARRWKYLLMRPARKATGALTLQSRFFSEIMPGATAKESKAGSSLDKRDRYESVEGTDMAL
jgi:hypothetical protein